MSRPDVDGLNAGYAALLLEQYLDNPAAVPAEWRTLFEEDPEAVLAVNPGLARLLERLERNGGNGHAAVAEPAPAPPRRPPPRLPRPPRWTTSSSAASPPRWRSSRRSACTGTSPHGSTRSDRSRPATRRSSPSG